MSEQSGHLVQNAAIQNHLRLLVRSRYDVAHGAQRSRLHLQTLLFALKLITYVTVLDSVLAKFFPKIQNKLNIFLSKKNTLTSGFPNKGTKNGTTPLSMTIWICSLPPYSQLLLYRTRLYRNSHIPDREFQSHRNSSQYVLYSPVIRIYRISYIPDSKS